MSALERVVVLVDMDCFYVQVEQQLAPETRDLPCAVVQYNTWRGGSVLAVDYTARHYGVTRGTTGEEAAAKCPKLHLFRVPEKRGKADLTRYRQVGAKVIQVLSEHCQRVERASVDEAFLELSDEVAGVNHAQPSSADLAHTVVAGWHSKAASEDDRGGGVETVREEERVDVVEWLEGEGSKEEKGLAVAAAMVQQIRDAVRRETRCTCSAGIARNKMLAKLAAGMNKPNGQTILPSSCVLTVLSGTPIRKIRYLGGKLGAEVAQQLKIASFGQLCHISMATLQSMFGQKTGLWLHGLCRGRDGEPVRPRQLPQSIGCGKNFPGPAKLTTVEQIQHWLGVLASELVERLTEDKDQNRRYATQLTVHFQPSSSDRGVSHCCRLPGYDTSRVVEEALAAMKRHRISQHWLSEISQLSLSASKFANCSSQTLYTFLCGSETHSNGIQRGASTKRQACSKRQNDSSSPELKRQRVEENAATGSTVHSIDTVKEVKGDVTYLGEVGDGVRYSKAVTDEDEYSGQLLAGDIEYPDEVLEKCCECGGKVPVWLVQEHNDHHLAVKLQEQLKHKPTTVELSSSKGKVAVNSRTLETFFHK